MISYLIQECVLLVALFPITLYKIEETLSGMPWSFFFALLFSLTHHYLTNSLSSYLYYSCHSLVEYKLHEGRACLFLLLLCYKYLKKYPAQ